MAYVRLCSQTLLSTAPNLFLSKTKRSENIAKFLISVKKSWRKNYIKVLSSRGFIRMVIWGISSTVSKLRSTTPPRSGHPLQYDKGFLRWNFAKNILVSEMFVLQILYRRPLNSFKGIPNFLAKCLSITSRSIMIADSFGLRSRGTHCCQSSCLLL